MDDFVTRLEDRDAGQVSSCMIVIHKIPNELDGISGTQPICDVLQTDEPAIPVQYHFAHSKPPLLPVADHPQILVARHGIRHVIQSQAHHHVHNILLNLFFGRIVAGSALLRKFERFLCGGQHRCVIGVTGDSTMGRQLFCPDNALRCQASISSSPPCLRPIAIWIICVGPSERIFGI